MAEESGGAFISGRSEEDEVILKQMNSSPFGGGDVMNMFLKGLERFGYNFSVIADTLIQFFQNRPNKNAIQNKMNPGIYVWICSLSVF